MPTCEFVFDLGSSYSYLASTQLKALAARTGATIELVPVVLGAVFKSVGREDLPPAPRLAWMRRDMSLWATRYGLSLEFPESFPTRTILALRTIVAAGQGGEGNDHRAMHALFATYWAKGQDLADPAVVRSALDGAGLDGAALIAKAEEKAVKDVLRANTDQAIARGVFGAPTFFVGDQLFFGNDRLDFVESALRATQ